MKFHSIIIITSLLLINPVIALTPYKIEKIEIPISGYSPNIPFNEPSIYEDLIAYRSGRNEISLYNINSNKSEVIASSPFELLRPKVYGDYLLYRIKYRNGKGELIKYNIETGKSIVLAPLDMTGNFEPEFIFDKDVAILPINCNSYPNYSSCVAWENEKRVSGCIAWINITSDKEYPEAYCLKYKPLDKYNKLDRKKFSDYKVITNDFPKDYKDPSNCLIYNILTGNETFLTNCIQIKNDKILLNLKSVYNLRTDEMISIPDEFDDSCGAKMLSNNGVWGIHHGSGAVCYYDFDTKILLRGSGSSYSFDYYNDKIVFFTPNKSVYGKGFLGYVKYGNLNEICSNYSERIISGNITIITSCSITNQTVCSCKIQGNETINNSITYLNFNLINLDENNINRTFNEIYSNINTNLQSQIEQKRIEEKEIEARIVKEKQTKEIMFYFIIAIIVTFIIGISWEYLDWRNQRKILINNAKKELDSTREFISKSKTSNILKSEKRYAKLYKEAIDAFNNKKYQEAINLAKKSRKLKNEEILERKRKLEEKRKRKEEEQRRLEEEKKRKAEERFRKKQLSKGLVEYKGKWVTKSQAKKLKAIDIGLDKNFMNLTGYEFEEFIAELFRKMGYKTEVTPKAKDYGIDVIAKGHGDIVAIQCKKNKEGSNVGNRDVQRARGSMDFFNANKCIIVTTADFTIEAKEQARRTKNMELWNKRTLHRMVRRYFIEESQ